MKINSLIISLLITFFSCSEKKSLNNDSIYYNEFYSILNDLITLRFWNVVVINSETTPVFKTRWGNTPIPKGEFLVQRPSPEFVNYFDVHSFNSEIELKHLDYVDAKYIYNSIDSTKIIQLDSNRVIIPIIIRVKHEELFNKYGILNDPIGLKKIYGPGCMLRVSTPLFNDNFTKAILFVDKFCGGLSGQGWYLLLEKKNAKWNIINERLTWES